MFSCLLARYHSGDQTKRLRWAGHVPRRGERRFAYRVLEGGGNLREGEYLENPGIGRRIILKWISEKWDRVMIWLDLGRNKWRAVLNAVMNLRFP
jgi:hypothetical protein